MATGLTSRIKARLQRAAYRNAFRSADCMIYISEHLRDLYRQNAGNVAECRSLIGYLGINDDAWAAATAASNSAVSHDPYTVLCISAMAPWKGAETLVSAIGVLRGKGVPARLRLVGPWPDARYESIVRNRIESEGVQSAVDVAGRVSVEQLHREYASAAVYCLMSKCESFGIPALEGQAFGVPVVGSNVCAMPEICGSGGVYGPPDDPESTASLLLPFLTDPGYRETMSRLARQNANRFHWDDCSRPLLDLLMPGAGMVSSKNTVPVSTAV
jgi:glycosyltransferase involved in cell wall biosynthesis